MTVEELVAHSKMKIAGIEQQMKSAEITGRPVETIPGAENDEPVPEEAKKPDPQVADGSMGPASAYNEGGAEPKNEPVGQLFEADEPVLNPEKKPMDSADANAKEASDKLANELLADILAIQKKAEIVAEKETPEVTKKPEESADANADAENEDKGGEKETVVPDVTVSDTTPEKDNDVNESKEAGASDLELTTDLLAKLACYMLAEEEGADLAERVLSKVAGAEAANDVMDFLSKQAEAAEYQAEFEKGAQAAEAMIGDAAEAQGAADAEALIGDAMAEQEDDQITVDEFLTELENMVSSGDISEDDAQAALQAVGLTEDAAEDPEIQDEDIDAETLAMGIQQAIEDGDLTPEDAEALVEALTEYASPDVAQDIHEGVDSEPAASEVPEETQVEPPAEVPSEAEVAQAAEQVAPAPEEAKEASDKTILALIDQIKRAACKRSKKSGKCKGC